jgi:hypothetical protein
MRSLLGALRFHRRFPGLRILKFLRTIRLEYGKEGEDSPWICLEPFSLRVHLLVTTILSHSSAG